MNKSIFRFALLALAVLGFIGSAAPASALAAALDVWWPVNNVTVSGTQPFKGLVTDVPVESYDMYWQVDGGQLNRMDNDYRDYPHKEAAVDLNPWTWRPSGEYKVNFVAKSPQGAVIAEKLITIYTNQGATPSSVVNSPAPAPAPAPTPTPTPAPTPTPTTNPTPTPTPTTGTDPVSTSPSSVTTSVWWPVDGVTVSGTQPFKARVEGIRLREYSMYWQVDGGVLNAMRDNSSDGGFKEANVDLTNWNWKGQGPYTVTFVAKNRRNTEIGRKSVQIFTNSSAPKPVTPTPTTPTPTTPTPTPTTPTPTPTPSTPTAPNTSTPTPVVAGNPLSGLSFFIDPNNPAKRQADQWRTSRPSDAVQMDKIAGQPGARWFGNWNGNIRDDVRAYVDTAASRGQVPVMIAYNIPQRDCGSYSAGGVGSPDAYRTWIRAFAEGIGTRKAVVILEPDAITLTDCLSAADKATRFSLIKEATGILKANGKTVVYLDSGHSNWLGASEMASRLASAGVQSADGFALNVSNFEPTNNLIAYGTTISNQIGGKHFVIDTSRNGLGSNGQWCNPDGRALGAKVTSATGNQLIDAFLWLKVPGESDGTCNGGPSAGSWWPEYALGLAQRASY